MLQCDGIAILYLQRLHELSLNSMTIRTFIFVFVVIRLLTPAK